MYRRKVLTGIAATVPLSGCANIQPPTKSSSVEKLRSAAEFPLKSEQDGVSVTITKKLSELNAEFVVGVVRGKSDTHPPQIGGVFKNTADHRQTFAFGSDSPLAPMSDIPPNPKIHLLKPPSDGEYKQSGCWRSPPHSWIASLRSIELEPGSMISNKLDVFGAPDVDACLPSGTYEFRQLVDEVDSEKGDKLTFSLTLP